MTPQQRAIHALKAEGFEVQTVEQVKRIPGGRTWRVDLWGAFDLLAVNSAGEIRAIQVTSRSNVSARVRKLSDMPVLGWLRRAGWSLEIWGWGKTVRSGEWKRIDLS